MLCLSSGPIRICSDHFVKGQTASLYEKDDPDWAPSLRLGHAGVKEGTATQERHSRSLVVTLTAYVMHALMHRNLL